MLDTFFLGIDEGFSTQCINGVPGNKKFQLRGLIGRLETTKPGTHFHKRGADWILHLSNGDGSVCFSGPVYIDRGRIELLKVRINAPRLLGLPPGSLPENDRQLQDLWPKLFSVTVPCIAAGLFRSKWLDAARVKELHVTANYEIPFDELEKHHLTMRHPRVRRDPVKLHPAQRSLYWLGKHCRICLYDKTYELLKKAYKPGKNQPSVRLPQTTRLEFRLKDGALQRELDRVTADPEHPSGMPPKPVRGAKLAPKCITAALLLQIFRNLVEEFPSLPKRKPQRLGVAILVAMLHKEGARLEDGTPVMEFYSLFASERNARHAQSLSASVDTGREVFSWSEFLGPEGWGPLARFTILPL